LAGKIKDLTGMMFGRWKVICDSGERTEYRAVKWLCECQCENKTRRLVVGGRLVNGDSKSCGCLTKETNTKLNTLDILGKQFGRWKVLEYVGSNSSNQSLWKCECQCDKKVIKIIVGAYLTIGRTLSCGCIQEENKDLTGQKFGNWLVLEKAENDKFGNIMWKCQCQCTKQTIRIIRGSCLINERSRSCGCLTRLLNEYDLSGEYGIGWTTNTNQEFYFDLEDYDKIKDYTWQTNGNGYIITTLNSKVIWLHRFIMNIQDKEMVVDHIFHKLYDNRKSQLRICTTQQNNFNRKSKGVYWSKKDKKWVGALICDNVTYRKYFDIYEEALEYRKQLEKQYFGEFAYKEIEDNE